MPALPLAASMLLCTLLLGADATEPGGVRPLKVPPQHKPLNNRFIVKWKHAAGGGDTSGLAAHVHAAAGRTRVQMAGLRHDVHSRQSVVRLSGYTAKAKAAVRAALVRAVAADPAVEYIVEDRLMHPSLAPNDPGYYAQWHYPGVVSGGVFSSGLTYGMNLPDAWARTTGTPVTVAVVDTGITSHPDLNAKVLAGYDMISPDSPGVFTVANDGDGRDPNPADPGDWTVDEDSSWHGTHVSGTIAALTNNGVGVAGVSWGAKILPVRALGTGGGYNSDINDAVRWAAGLPVSGVPANPTPARVISLSLGGDGACDQASQEAIDAAVKAGAVLVIAAGNENQDTTNKSPCNCQRVICVASHGPSGQRAVYSNFGAAVDITAPGGDSALGKGTYAVLSTWNNGTRGLGSPVYAFMEGTSMATPHVSGLVALLLSVNANLTSENVEAVLKRTARPFPAPNVAPRNCAATTCGAGLADAAQAVAFVAAMPANDRCAAALPVTCGQVVRGSVQNATAASADPQCGGTSPTGADVWFTLQLSEPGPLRLSTNLSDTDFDTQLNVYGGNCSSLRCVAGNNNCSGCGLRSDLSLSASAGTWLIRVSGTGSARGAFALQVSCGADPSPSPLPSAAGNPGLSASASPSRSPSAGHSASESPRPSPSGPPSQSPSRSLSPQPSPSPSPKASSSQSPNPSGSPSPKASPSQSPNPSHSPSDRPSQSPGRSPSPLASVSRSPRASHSESPSHSDSRSPSPLASVSRSPRPSPSESPEPSPSPSPKPSHSASRSPSPLASVSRSPRASHSESPSHSDSRSPSPLASVSRSPRPSHSESPEPSPSRSPKPSNSASRSPRASHSESPSHSDSRSPSPLASVSRSPRASPSESPSHSASRSPSPSPSAKPSQSSSRSPSPPATGSRSPKASPSDSPNPSPSPSPSPSSAGPACRAVQVTCNSTTTSTTIGQPTSGGSLACQGVAHTAPDRWFVLSGLPAGRSVSLSALGAADFAPRLSAFTGVCDSPACFAANTTAPGSTLCRLAARAYGPLYVMVHGNQTAVGAFNLTVTCN